MGFFGRDKAPTGTLTDVRVDSVELPELRVVVTAPRQAVIRLTLGVAPAILGTDPECDIVLADPRVSRRHCSIHLEPRGVVLRDLGSKNGTMVGDVAIVEAILPPGAKVVIGSTRIVLESGKGRAVVPLSRGVRFGEAFGASVAMRALFAQLEQAAQTDATVILFGESGTGKELLARGLHDRSPRREGPFVVFDCSAVAPALVESELFGHVRGAFTGAERARDGLFAQAHRGTLFIDELGELPLELQPKLLRALESHQVRPVGGGDWTTIDVRVVAATHRDLRSRVQSGEFRADLYYRLAVLVATVPPLRDRKDDIQPLVEHFLAGHRPPRTLADMPPNVVDMLRAHDWPGNVRELRNTVARLVLLGREGDLPIDEAVAGAGAGVALGANLGARAGGGGPGRAGAGGGPGPWGAGGAAGTGGAAGAGGPRLVMPALSDVLPMPLRDARDVVVEHFERTYLTAKLNEHAGNVSRAADAIGVSRQFLHRLIERYGLKARG